MKDKPLVTILSPCYNVEAFLPQCLDSIVNQKYSNIQIVMIDDGSKDNTWGILQEYAAKDSRIEIYHQENQGVAAVRNRLLEKVKGDYVLFVDSDDWIELDMAEFLISKAIQSNSEMVTCGCVPQGGKSGDHVISEELWDKDKCIFEFLRHVSFAGSLWNKLIKTDIIKDTRFDTRISYGEDALFCWNIIQSIEKILITDAQLYNHRVNENSLSTSAWSPNKKGSGSIVWKAISEDASKRYPQYADIVNARYAIENMWGLYYASLANYPHDVEIAKRQKHVRESFKLISHSGLVGKNKLVFAWIICRWYGFGGCLRTLRKIKEQD